jgi:hypothetical protein
MPAADESLLRVSPDFTMYAIQPGGISQGVGSVLRNSVDTSVNVGVSVAVAEGVIVGAMVAVSAGNSVAVNSTGGVEVSILSNVGYAAIALVCVPSEEASKMLPITITIDTPAARAPAITLLKPNNPSFIWLNVFLTREKLSSWLTHLMPDQDQIGASEFDLQSFY